MKIMIVDDSKIMRMHIIRGFRQAGLTGHDFVECANGQEAWEAIQNEQPDLLLTDLNMPEMDGATLLNHVKEAGMTFPYGVISSQSTDEIRSKVTELGAKFLLAKPFKPDSIKEALESIVS